MTDAFQGNVHRVAEPVMSHREKGRRQQRVVAAAAVDGAAGRIAAEAAVECGRLDFLVQFHRRIERIAAIAVGHQFDRPEQPASSDIADMAVIAKTLGQPPLELAAALLDLSKKSSLLPSSPPSALSSDRV